MKTKKIITVPISALTLVFLAGCQANSNQPLTQNTPPAEITRTAEATSTVQVMNSTIPNDQSQQTQVKSSQ